MNPDDVRAYYNRGDVKKLMGEMEDACSDWRIAYSLGYQDAAKWVSNQCQ